MCQIQEGDEVVQAEGAVAMRVSEKLPLLLVPVLFGVFGMARPGVGRGRRAAVDRDGGVGADDFKPGSAGEADYRITVTNTGGWSRTANRSRSLTNCRRVWRSIRGYIRGRPVRQYVKGRARAIRVCAVVVHVYRYGGSR